MRTKRITIIIATMALLGGGLAYAGHVAQVDPSTVPLGMLVTHNQISDVPVSAVARAAASDGAQVYIQHLRLAQGETTPWHTHPGPVFVSVASGTFLYQYSDKGVCTATPYAAGTGFVDNRTLHRGVGGTGGADVYAFFLLPPDETTHIHPTSTPPPGC